MKSAQGLWIKETKFQPYQKDDLVWLDAKNITTTQELLLFWQGGIFLKLTFRQCKPPCLLNNKIGDMYRTTRSFFPQWHPTLVDINTAVQLICMNNCLIMEHRYMKFLAISEIGLNRIQSIICVRSAQPKSQFSVKNNNNSAFRPYLSFSANFVKNSILYLITSLRSWLSM